MGYLFGSDVVMKEIRFVNLKRRLSYVLALLFLLFEEQPYSAK